ncbi:uncharacterized protein LOC131670557 [Phymastichus coffea]|uniref:uncharacterized protein LOC131670557 n=1 Tax=Phymastichus coffea TaxID=108790 RepID=UPI00273CB14E|nr:uncharacterized protein LOC131670557 [Phymastichus coffea]
MPRKCCAHCPGSASRGGEPIREHACALPERVAGAEPVPRSRPRGHRCKGPRSASSDRRGDERHRQQQQQQQQQHQQQQQQQQHQQQHRRRRQPSSSCRQRFAVARKLHAENLQHQDLPDRVDDAIFVQDKRAEQPCTSEAVERCPSIVPGRLHEQRGPALGCKKPATYMDLAICWETPVDASYEPRRAAHVDGSDGGPAPAIFALVSHEDSRLDVRAGRIPGRREDEQDDGEELCGRLDSAVRLGARSASCPRRSGRAGVARGHDGLPADRGRVPRPRTPYARRSFCIDTLAPPFSVVRGCRDADYPEHWRLTSIYQQSYRNPSKLREGRTILSYARRGR